MRHVATLYLGLWVLTSGFSLLASNLIPYAAPQQRPQFRAAVDLIQVDVSVLDSVRRPLRGLSAGDFTVLEDGVPQRVMAFTEFHVPDPVAPSAPWMRELPPDVRTNAGDDGRLIVIVLDDATAPCGLPARS